MKVLRMVRNLVLLVLGVILCAILALAFLGWQMYTQALEATPLDQRSNRCGPRRATPPLRSCPRPMWTLSSPRRTTASTQHNGIDVIAIGRAVVNDIKAMSFVEGGSTITQQLAKNLYFTQEKRLTRRRLRCSWPSTSRPTTPRRRFSSCTSTPFTSAAAATTWPRPAQAYFGVEPSQMDANQCTLLAGIPNAPSVYDLNVNPDLATQRQRQVLTLMVEHQYLTADQASAIQPAA